MTIKSTLYKNQGGPDFTTPTQGYVRNISLGYHKSPPAGKIRPSKVYWVPKGKTAGEEFYSFTGAPHEFDVDIPGTGTPVEWLQAGGHSLIEDYTTCTPSQADMEIAEFRSKIEPALIQNIISDVVRCEMMGIYKQQHPHGEGVGSYDEPPQTEEEAVQIAVTVSDEIDKDANTLAIRIGFLDDIAKKAGIQAGWIKLWADGPDALRDGLKYAKLIPAHWKKPTVKASAYLLGQDVIALNQFSPTASGILYKIGEAHGPEWNTFLEAALVEHDKLVEAEAAKAQKTVTPVKTFSAGDSTVYRLGATPGARIVRKPTEGPPPKAAGIHQYRVEKTKEQSAAHLENVKRDAREFHAQEQRALVHHLNDALKDAVAWMTTCSPPGKAQSFPLPVGQITVVCGDPDSINRLNTPEIAAQLNAELAGDMGVPPPPPPPTKKKGSPLPLILAVGGFLFGGPLGAGAGFAIGKSMEKKDASQTL